jgi:hypothetical protein
MDIISQGKMLIGNNTYHKNFNEIEDQNLWLEARHCGSIQSKWYFKILNCFNGMELNIYQRLYSAF